MKQSKIKISPILIPETCWRSNVRDHVPQSQWDKIRRSVYASANYKCIICNGDGKDQGFRHSVEAHEIWEYDDFKKIQTLVQIACLCPNCHRCFHLGLAKVKGWYDETMDWLADINNMSSIEAYKLSDSAFETYRRRSRHQWKLNLDFLEKYYGLKVEPKR